MYVNTISASCKIYYVFNIILKALDNIEKYCEALDILQNLWFWLGFEHIQKNQYVSCLDDRDQYFWINNNKYNMQ